MRCRKEFLFILVIVLLSAAPFVVKAQPPPQGDAPALPATATAAPRPLAELLPDKLAGMRAVSDVKQYASDKLAELVADRAAAYQEYLVTQAVSRQ
ncbi:MAG TPA: hypothetical protein VNI02_08935, partial [Blastocatellia bacterium]|nr:hypothetical protein [Blastocatellia bacterium]